MADALTLLWANAWTTLLILKKGAVPLIFAITIELYFYFKKLSHGEEVFFGYEHFLELGAVLVLCYNVQTKGF